MDKGAHFFRCDLQVHTPRDTNWSGPKPTADDHRREYARGFIRACRDKGLDAVAITDHHDLGFFPFIREAAANELLESGEPVSAEKRIHVFPGMELTLAVPCQALLLFDANFPIQLFDPVIGRLGIVCNSPADATHAPTLRLDHLKTFQQIADLIDVLPFAKGRYILLPNVNPKGEFTMMREGFLAEYKAMPCVGGYLDHPVEKLGVGDRNILDGKTKAYAFKPLGLFPTSDNRSSDFSKLGTNTVWVKWAEPTAEAIRQACLARLTRISHTPPKTPHVVVSRIEISNSKFLGPLNLELNPQFNCLIGGRGTGKSTLLEYLRWALCDQPPGEEDSDETGSLATKRRKLIENTLHQIGGAITVDVIINGIRHTVRRKSDTGELLLKVGEHPMKQANEDEIRSLLPIQGYSQKQLSGVGVRGEELSRFLESAGTRDALDKLSADAAKTAEDVRKAFLEVETKRNYAKNTEHLKVQLSSIEQQMAALKAGLKGLSPEDNQTLGEHEQFLAGNAMFEQWKADTETISEVVRRALSSLDALPHRLPAGREVPHDRNLVEAERLLVEMFKKARASIEEAGQSVSSRSPDWTAFQEAKGTWTAASSEHNVRYESVRNRVGEQQETLKQIAILEEQVSKTKGQIAEAEAIAAGLGGARIAYGQHREDWKQKFSGRADLLQTRCELLSGLSDGWIKATLKRGVMGQRLSDLLSRMLQGSRIHSLSEKLETLSSKITDAQNPMEHWETVLGELDVLSLQKDAELPGDFKSPILQTSGFNGNDLQKIAARLERQSWLELSLIELEDTPVFEYRQREDDYIPFAEASAGQQATALLRVLLNQEGPPLVIDQPEDDLDNEVIYEVAEQIGYAKLILPGKRGREMNQLNLEIG